MELIRLISKCGVICSRNCCAYQVECEGCNELEGKVSWAQFYGLERCPIYTFVVDQGYQTCADCGKQPCRLWIETRDPSASDEAFEADLSTRIKNLKAMLVQMGDED